MRCLHVSVHAKPVFKSLMADMLDGGGANGLLPKNRQSLSTILGSLNREANAALASFHKTSATALLLGSMIFVEMLCFSGVTLWRAQSFLHVFWALA